MALWACFAQFIGVTHRHGGGLVSPLCDTDVRYTTSVSQSEETKWLALAAHVPRPYEEHAYSYEAPNNLDTLGRITQPKRGPFANMLCELGIDEGEDALE